MKKFTKFLSIMLCLMMFPFAACSNDVEQESAIIWSALSTEKFRQDEVLTNYPEAKLDFVGMKGETTALQIMITAKEDIKSFNLTVSDLQGENGEVFSKDNFKVYAERYIEVYNPYINATKHGKIYISEAGFYPDALVPIDRYIANREAKIYSGKNQGIWIDCIIPTNAVSGSFTGEFTLQYGDETKQIPITLFIYDLTMPEQVHSISLFSIWYEQLAMGEKDNYSTETDQIYYDFLLSKRLCSKKVPPAYEQDLETYLNYVIENTENPKVTSFYVPEKFAGANKNIYAPKPVDEAKYSEAQRLQEMDKLQVGLKNLIVTILEKNIELRNGANEDINLFEKLYFCTEDEPARASQYRLDRVRIFGEKLTAAKREVIEEKADVWNTHPDLKKSIERLTQYCASNLVEEGAGVLTVSSKNGQDEPYVPDYEKGDGLTLWCPEQYKFKDQAFRDAVKQRQSFGERFIWYNCCSNSPVMSYYVESIPVSIRMHSWMQYEFGIEGILYWDTVHFGVLNDPYEDLYYEKFGAGEGILLYPGIKYGMKTPVSSIRLEQIFHGQQDYEYLFMLDEYLKLNQFEVTSSEIISKLMVNLYSDGYTLETAKGSDLEAARVEVLNILQDFANNSISAAQEKINKILN